MRENCRRELIMEDQILRDSQNRSVPRCTRKCMQVSKVAE